MAGTFPPLGSSPDDLARCTSRWDAVRAWAQPDQLLRFLSSQRAYLTASNSRS